MEELVHLFDSSSSSSSSGSSGEEFLAEVAENILPNLMIPELLLDKPKNEGYVEETLPLYSDRQFIEHFRWVWQFMLVQGTTLKI